MRGNLSIKIQKLASEEITEIKEKWKEAIVPKEKNGDAIHLCDLIWKILCNQIPVCETGEQAVASFKIISKDDLYIFGQHKDIGFSVENAKAFSLDDLIQFSNDFGPTDIFVTDKEFTWTFIETHEVVLGPYFFKKRA